MRTTWPTIPLGEIAVNRGGSTNPALFQNEIFELYSIPAYDQGIPDIVSGKEIGSPKKNVEPNDLLLSRIVPHIQRVWIVGKKGPNRQIASGEWIVYRSNKFHPPYLRYALLTKDFHSQFMQTISGVGGSLLRARPEQVGEIEIPLPPLAEQKRIAAILDKADAIRSKRQAAIKLAADFLRATFLDMFGDPVTNPKGWKVKKLNDIAGIQSGITKGRKIVGVETKNVPYMRVANVQDGHVNLNEVKMIEATPVEIRRYLLTKGDILLTEGGDPDKLGRGAVWHGEINPCIHQNHIFRVRLDAAYALPEYLSALIGSARGKKYFLIAAKQTTGIASINKTQLSGFPVLIPPIVLQEKFSQVVKKQELLQKALIVLVDQNNYCFNSLTQRAFLGEL